MGPGSPYPAWHLVYMVPGSRPASRMILLGNISLQRIIVPVMLMRYAPATGARMVVLLCRGGLRRSAYGLVLLCGA
jgi:hypothetical protein